MQIELRPPSELKPYEGNPRRNDAAVDRVAASIREYGFRQPIVVDEHGVIVVGHTRWKAAVKLGLDAVPVHVAHDLTPEQARAYRLADNKTNELAEWDEDLLPVELLSLRDLGIDPGSLGWSAEELDELLAPAGNAGLSDPDDVPEPPETPVTQPGDLWLLGEHRLLCGDSTNPAHVALVMDGARADMLWGDPPYGIEVVGGSRAMSQAERLAAGGKTISNDGVDPEKLRELLRASLGLAVGACKQGAPWYVAGPGGMNAQVFAGVLTELGVGRHILVWVKDRFVLGRCDFHYRHEFIFYGWTPGKAHRSPGQRDLDTVWEVPRPSRSQAHPTMKPVELVARALEASSARGGVVYEPFSGSGTTIIACEQQGRKCRAVELEPRYVDVAVERWESFTGSKAQRVPAGSASEKAPAGAGAVKEAA